MFYFKFTADTPYVGTEDTDYCAFVGQRPTDEELDELAKEFCQLNAKKFGYLATDDVAEELDEEEEEEILENYYAECTCTWEEITKEELIEEGLVEEGALERN